MTSRVGRILQSIRKEIPQALAEGQDHDDAEIAAMLRELGIALVECEQPTQLVAARLLAIANQYTSETVRVVVLPTALVVQVGTVAYEVETVVKPTTQLNLAGRIDAIAELAEVGAITPADAAREAAAARTMPPRFGPVITVIGYTITTVGFGMVINPTWASLWGYVFLGTVVGVIVMLGRPFPTLNAVLPTLAAAVVTSLAIWFVADAANDGLLRVISPAAGGDAAGVGVDDRRDGIGQRAGHQWCQPTDLRGGATDVARLRCRVGHPCRGPARSATTVAADGWVVAVRRCRRDLDRAVHLSVGTQGIAACG